MYVAYTLKLSSSHPFQGYCIVSPHNSFNISDIKVTITARCAEDDTVEAFEIEQYKVFCAMWHPERIEDFNEVDLELISKHFRLWHSNFSAIESPEKKQKTVARFELETKPNLIKWTNTLILIHNISYWVVGKLRKTWITCTPADSNFFMSSDGLT